MTNIEQAIERFTADLGALLRKQAIEEASRALGQKPHGRPGRRPLGQGEVTPGSFLQRIVETYRTRGQFQTWQAAELATAKGRSRDVTTSIALRTGIERGLIRRVGRGVYEVA